MSTFSNSLKTIRRRSNITQEQLAAQLNVTRQTVSSWETGRCEPDINTLMNLAEALNTPVEELIYGRPPVQNAYPRFQRKYFWWIAGCGLVLLAYFYIAGVLLPLAQNWMFPSWLLRWTITIRQVSRFTAGVGLMAILALFFPVGFDRRKRRICLIIGLVTALPILLIAGETLLSILIPAFKLRLTFIFIHLIARDMGKLIWLSAVPFLSGVLLFLGCNRE